MKLLPSNDIYRHRFIVNAVAVILAVIAVTGWDAVRPNIPTSTVRKTESARPIVALVAAASPSAATTESTQSLKPTPAAGKGSWTPIVRNGAKPASVMPAKKVVAEVGTLDKGRTLPALYLNMSPSTFRWLVGNGYASVLARSGDRVWRITPDPVLGFKRAHVYAYVAEDAKRLSTRNVLLTDTNPWVSPSALAEQVRSAAPDAGALGFELRLTNALDYRLARVQLAEMRRRGIAQGSPLFESTAVSIMVESGSSGPLLRVE